MSTRPKPTLTLQQIAAESRYPLDAFHFVRRGLDYTAGRLQKNPHSPDEDERHVTGRDLCEGLRDFAVEQYGRLARTVLRRWRIVRTEDFGRLVFEMVDGGLMQATEHDSVRDFEAVYDFADAFDVPISVDRIVADPPPLNPVQQQQG